MCLMCQSGIPALTDGTCPVNANCTFAFQAISLTITQIAPAVLKTAMFALTI
jgi:hypothetical protein